MMKKCLLVLLVMGFLACPAVLHAQSCRVVTPSGSGNKSGSDWNNAMAGLPNPMVRGLTYYLADGTYPPYSSFSVPVSGASMVTIKKAIPTDHCTNTGWNASAMGSAQAIFQNGSGTTCANFSIANTANTGYLTIDGQTGSGNKGSSYGIKFLGNYVNTQCGSGSANVYIDYGYSGRTATNIIIEYVEMVGSCGGLTMDSSYEPNCHRIADSTANGGYQKHDTNIYINDCTNCTFNHIYLHQSSGVPFFLVNGSSNITTEHNYIWLNQATSAEHAESWSSHGGNSNITIAYSIYRDQMGNGVFVSLNSGTAETDSNVQVYSNVIWATPGNPYGNAYGYGDGILSCINGNNCPGWLLYQNTIANLTSVYDGVSYLNGATGDVTVENNLWYNSQASSGTQFFMPGGSTENYNSFLNYIRAPDGNGAHDVMVVSGSPDPFTNWTAGDFTLASDNAKWNSRASLPTGKWNTDAAGNAFTTDRGAYQYGSGTASTPGPPSNLSVVSVN